MIIKKFILLSIFLLSIFLLNNATAQIQLNGGYNNLALELNGNSNTEIINEDLTGWSVEAAYWFRLKDFRVEFYPGIGYSSLTLDNSSPFDEYELNLTHLFWGTRVYPFTFEDDCMCPTFNKQSGFFEDGFFISFTPHFIFSEQFTRFDALEKDQVKSNTYLLDFGVGLDLGVSEFLTITPELRYRLSGDFDSSLSSIDDNPNYWDSNVSGWYFGLGIGIRWQN
ncbi:MAG: hypothetical protein EA362_04235 [Saprospirales bacterium]|nr:MAG: hypothetical protein EA362_04235 [Saprospirales bacterium]